WPGWARPSALGHIAGCGHRRCGIKFAVVVRRTTWRRWRPR
ncbi:MAG: hypothetical protein AVDCRST_MAG88-121, partial [uncultured Thermomicrobiales bacterium]